MFCLNGSLTGNRVCVTIRAKSNCVMNQYHAQLDVLFRLNYSVAETTQRINDAYGEFAISKSTVKRYFRLKKSGEEYSGHKPRCGRPRLDLGGFLHDLVIDEPFMTTRELANAFGCSHNTTWLRRRTMRLTSKWNIWVPHQLSAKHEEQRCHVA